MSFNKVYISAKAKANQYVLAEIKVTDALLSHYADYESCLRPLSRLVFNLAEQQGLRNVHVISNDKLPVVRFSHEAYTFQTAEQILFFYHPAYHNAQDSFFKPDYRPRKIRLLFMATGTEIRAEAAAFHNKVLHVLNALQPHLPDVPLPLKIRDHQHLSYDLFAREKGLKESYGYKLRDLYQRYRARACNLPAHHSEMAYIKVSIPLTRKLKKRVVPDGANDYSALYVWLEQQFISAAASKNINRLAFLANDLTPIVRNSKFDELTSTAELQPIGFDPDNNQLQIISHWNGQNLAASVNLIMAAGNADRTDTGYGRFVNQAEDILRNFASAIGIEPEQTELLVRFHQHISYQP